MKERSFKDYFKLFKRDVYQFIELKLEFYKLEFVDVFLTIFSKFIGVGVTLLVGIIFVNFLFFALAFFLGDLLGAYYWGFLIVSGLFLILAIIFLSLKDSILTNPLLNTMVNSLFAKEIKKEKRRKNRINGKK